MTVRGHDENFEDWYRGQHARLLSSMLVLTGDLHDAQEVTDEALARALVHWHRVQQMDSPGGWVYRVAVNVLRRKVRRSSVERRILNRGPNRESVPAPAGETWDVVRYLPVRQRTAIALRYIADLTEADIAVVMGVSRSTVSSTLADARHRLAEQLSEQTEPEEAHHG